MTRKTVAAFVVFVALLGLAYVLQNRPEKGERRGERPRPIPRLSSQRVRRVTLAHKDKTTVLQRDAKGRWQVVKPIKDDADPAAVKALLDKLAGLEFGDLVTQRADRHAQHGVDDAGGLRVTVSDGKKALARFVLGKAADGFTLLRAAGKNEVYQAVGALRPVFDRQLSQWRDRTIVKLAPQQIRRIQLGSREGIGAGGITLERSAADSPWQVASASPAITKLNPAAVKTTVAAVANLSAVDFDDDARPEAVGLAPPRVRCEVTAQGAPPVVLRIGKRKGDNFWVQRQGDPRLFLVRKYSLEQLDRRPIDFQDPTIFAFAPEQVRTLTLNHLQEKRRVTLRHEESSWRSPRGKTIEAPQKLDRALKTLATLQASGYARHSAEDLGLTSPQWEVTVGLADGSERTLQVGSKVIAGQYGVRRPDRPQQLYTLRRHVVDGLMLDPANYK